MLLNNKPLHCEVGIYGSIMTLLCCAILTWQWSVEGGALDCS